MRERRWRVTGTHPRNAEHPAVVSEAVKDYVRHRAGATRLSSRFVYPMRITGKVGQREIQASRPRLQVCLVSTNLLCTRAIGAGERLHKFRPRCSVGSSELFSTIDVG